jgi:pimeloyl-ACP methyl ester carboxylesterase
VPELTNGEVTLWYSERGDPEGPVVVLLHGLFFSRRTFERLALRLPGYRLLLLDLRGHGRSSRPADSEAYSWSLMASDVAALLDRLGIERAVVGGLSLGANVTLAFAARHVDRLTGAVIEMPVLETGRPQAERTFRPLAAALDVAGAVLRPATRAAAPLRRSRQPELAAAADLLSLEPVAAAAMLRTLLADRQPVLDGVDALAGASVPTLVIAHRLDSLHPVADARYVADRVPGARLVVVSSIAELRVRAARYADLVGGFLAGLPDSDHPGHPRQ